MGSYSRKKSQSCKSAGNRQNPALLHRHQHPSVPATNNLAERLLRLYKVQQKISGCYRSVAGAVAQANLRTMLETARMQGWNVLETIEAGPAAASTMLKTP